MLSAVVKEDFGRYWRDVCVIKFSREGDIQCSNPEYAPSEDEQKAIKEGFQGVEFPTLIKPRRISDPPPEMAAADKQNIFEFRDLAGDIVMVQVRMNTKGGGKKYLPFTYWSDQRWRNMEPEGPLPLYNLHRLKGHGIAFLHEGPKAAAHCQWLADAKSYEARDALKAHPWGDRLQLGAHLGWIGGALSPERTDWSPLVRSGISSVYIVADNDEVGRSAVPKISRQINATCTLVAFGEGFPVSFDLADEFPESMFRTLPNGKRLYRGPSFLDCCQPATWMTKLIPQKRGRPIAVLREHVKETVAYIAEADAYVWVHRPDFIMDEKQFNKTVAAYSDVANTAALVTKESAETKAAFCYRPDINERKIVIDGRLKINVYVPPRIPSNTEDATLWEEYLSYLFPDADERREVKRWLATLIARPDIRMMYGLLLISEEQGIGKTTLGMQVLAPLVGQNNTSFTSENDILSNFNSWAAQKRLVVVSEIYTGSSWKAYHSIKSLITDARISVNEKFRKPYVIENYCHVIASSNSRRAMKMDQHDRRWFYPKLTSEPWPKDKWDAFYAWLDGPGLGAIKYWAESFNDYVRPGDKAPMTHLKQQLIEESQSEAQVLVRGLAESVNDSGDPIALIMSQIRSCVRQNCLEKVFETDSELRKVMIDAGLAQYDVRIKIGSHKEYVMLNAALVDLLKQVDEAGSEGSEGSEERGDRRSELNKTIREHIRSPGDFLPF